MPSIHEDLLIESGSLIARVARMQPIHHDRSKTCEGYMPSCLFINEKILTRYCLICKLKAYDGADKGCRNPGCATTLGYLAYLVIDGFFSLSFAIKP